MGRRLLLVCRVDEGGGLPLIGRLFQRLGWRCDGWILALLGLTGAVRNREVGVEREDGGRCSSVQFSSGRGRLGQCGDPRLSQSGSTGVYPRHSSGMNITILRLKPAQGVFFREVNMSRISNAVSKSSLVPPFP